MLVSHGGITDRGLGILGTVEVLAVFPEFGEKVVPGRSGVGDEVAGAEVVLAEILVDVGDAGLGVLPKLAVDGVFDAARPAGGEKEDGQRGCQAKLFTEGEEARPLVARKCQFDREISQFVRKAGVRVAV